MDKSEKVVQKANADLNSASTALEISYRSMTEINPPSQGSMREFLASKTLLASARGTIKHNMEWVEFSKEQVDLAKERLKLDMIEHEKFKHLELQEIQKEIKRIKQQDMKNLDEIALMTHSLKDRN